MVAHVRRGQGEERLARLVRRNGGNVSRAEVRLGRLCFTSLVVGAAVRAAVAAVRAGSDVAGVRVVRTVRVGLVYLAVLFGMMVIAACAGRTGLLAQRLSIRRLAVWRGPPSRRLAAFVSRWRAAAGSGAGRSSVGWVALLTVGGGVAGDPEPNFIAAAAGGAAGYCVSATVATNFIVRLKAGLVLQGGAAVPELGDGRPTAGLLVPLAAGGAQLRGGWRVWFTNLRAGLRQQGQRTLLGIQLQIKTDSDELWTCFGVLR